MGCMVLLTRAGQQICMPVAVDHSNSIVQSGYCSGTEKKVESKTHTFICEAEKSPEFWGHSKDL